MVSFIIVFAILIIGVIIWQLGSNTHYLRLSKQEYPELSLEVLITKKERKIQELVIRIHAKKDIIIEQIKIELISQKRDFDYINSIEVLDSNPFPILIQPSASSHISFPFEELKDLITARDTESVSFRVVVESKEDKVYKSHELKFDKFWKIYKLDSGRYN